MSKARVYYFLARESVVYGSTRGKGRTLRTLAPSFNVMGATHVFNKAEILDGAYGVEGSDKALYGNQLVKCRLGAKNRVKIFGNEYGTVILPKKNLHMIKITDDNIRTIEDVRTFVNGSVGEWISLEDKRKEEHKVQKQVKPIRLIALKDIEVCGETVKQYSQFEVADHKRSDTKILIDGEWYAIGYDVVEVPQEDVIKLESKVLSTLNNSLRKNTLTIKYKGGEERLILPIRIEEGAKGTLVHVYQVEGESSSDQNYGEKTLYIDHIHIVD